MTAAVAPPVTLLGGGCEPLIVHRPAAQAATSWVIMVHAVGENRTGNNYWQAHAAATLAGAGFTSARFDLSGYGESLGGKDVTVWARQVRLAARTAADQGAAEIYLTARGLHCSLLADVPDPVHRIALFPPDEDGLAWWSRRRPNLDPAGQVEANASPESAEREFWEACGAESRLVGGLEIPVATMDALIARLPVAEPSWDVAIVAARDDRRPRTARLVCGRDPLLRLESERAGLEHLLIRWLHGHLNCGGAST